MMKRTTKIRNCYQKKRKRLKPEKKLYFAPREYRRR